MIPELTAVWARGWDMRLVPDVVPNTFRGYNPRLRGSREFESAKNEHLYLTDGGMNGENIPLEPLLVKARRLDTIFAIDASQDTKKSWPNGRSLHRTLERIRLTANGYSDFPPVPTTAWHFLKAGLTRRRVFFGCDVGDARVENLGATRSYSNCPTPPSGTRATRPTPKRCKWSTPSNSDTEAFLDTAHANAMEGYPMRDAVAEVADPRYKTALKCAIVDRPRQRAGIKRSAICQSLMQRCEFLDGISEWIRSSSNAISYTVLTQKKVHTLVLPSSRRSA
ncbi:BZ3500_MvSof-1268-A1-R1_Chr1-1g00847 [Microbotryum saponariae]|uniref:Lysophospholipase n=1 Tax=Microbotryum saponariae TaxID=289078 RepID=A0A2X0KHF7_9BASI|nr:BZ3500_MvSof-1268-A1-R1_Chr1-1g00847 [Microbotryum saponariae]SCZ92769.1 BZ3501_MvSof-1269-A2-R1_Chr1-1g00444 [Microbotryum saponariae]